MQQQDPLNLLSLSELCKLFSVSRSGYYRWLSKADARKAREERDLEDFAKILKAYNYRGYNKGVYGIYCRLLHEGIRMNHKKIRRLMHKYGLICPIRKANPYRRMAKSLQTNKVCDNMVKREFKQHGPRKILLTDITYLPIKGGFVYLSVIIDAYTMQVLSYQVSDSLKVDFVLETVLKLMKKHAITLNTEVLVHSDQGCHYTSVAFQELLEHYHLRQSMSRRGNCWDNAPQESFFGHMKDELAQRIKHWRALEQVRYDVDDWIDYYNNDRGQRQLQHLSPNEYYNFITTRKYPANMA